MRLSILILFQILSFSLLAQNSKIRTKEFSLTIGFAELDIERFPSNEMLDFMNYIDSNPEYNDYITVKFGCKLDFHSKMLADIKLVLMDDVIPDSYDIAVHYFIKSWYGIGFGSMLFKHYISNFEEHQIYAFPDYYSDENLRQIRAYDLGFYISPALKPFDSDSFCLLLKCDLGVSSFLKEKTTFYHKRKLSNERMMYTYETKSNFQPYIQPKVDLRLRVFSIKNTAVGLLFGSSYYFTNRNIDYLGTIQKWTPDNSIKTNVQSPEHKYSRFECDLGVFLRW